MTSTRPYLAADDRRDQLLAAAGRVFDRDGLSGVTMVAVAKEAGVSRALVYHCFADQADLKTQLFLGRVQRYRELAREARERVAGSLRASVVATLEQLLAMPPGEQYALATILHTHGDPELDRVRDELRRFVREQWGPQLGDDAQTDELLTIGWLLIESAVSLGIAIDEGRLSRERAHAVLTALVIAAAQVA